MWCEYKSYPELLDQERDLYRIIGVARKRLDADESNERLKNIIEYDLWVLSEITDEILETLESIHVRQKEIRSLTEMG